MRQPILAINSAGWLVQATAIAIFLWAGFVPDKAVADEISIVPTKRPEPSAPSAVPAPSVPQPASIEDIQCQARLAASGAVFERTGPIVDEEDEGCGISQSLTVTSVGADTRLEPPAVLNCATALAFSDYVDGIVVPALARLNGDVQLSAITIGSSYVCRRRNNAQTGKLSEHAIGNAIDVSGLLFSDGRRLAIQPRDRTGSDEEAFQKAIRFGACQYFTTVLGPWSDAHHDDHLHFDLAERRGGYRLCRFPEIALDDDDG